MPKQLLNLSGNDALINETINRISSFIDKENIFIVTNESKRQIHPTLTRNQLHEIIFSKEVII